MSIGTASTTEFTGQKVVRMEAVVPCKDENSAPYIPDQLIKLSTVIFMLKFNSKNHVKNVNTLCADIVSMRYGKT